MNKKIILASGSPRRRELLEQIGLDFTVEISKGKEITSRTKPEEVVKELSYQKAKEVYDRTGKEAVIIGADTIVCFEDRILGKPTSEEEAREILKMMSGNVHKVYTGVTILWKSDDGNTHVLSFEEVTRVYLYRLNDEEIDKYIATGDARDKAGAYGIQGLFARYVEKIEGDYNNVVGLPVGRLYQELKKSRIV